MGRSFIAIARGGLVAAVLFIAPASPGRPVERCVRAEAIHHLAGEGDYSAFTERRPPCHDPANSALVNALRASARLDPTSALTAVDKYHLTGDIDPARRAIAAEVEADAAFLLARYGRAASAAAERSRLLSDAGEQLQAADAQQMSELARLLAEEPAQTILGGRAARFGSRTDAAGLTRAPVAIGSQTEQMVLDTGANVSVLSKSAARRVGLRLARGTASVGTSTRSSIPISVGIAPSVSIGGLRFANVAFLVLEDAQLAFPGGYRISGIVGLPILRQAGGLTVFKRGGMILAAPSSSSRASSARLFAHGSDLVVDAAVAGHRVALHLDSGANRTDFTHRFLERCPGLARNAVEEAAHRGGLAELQNDARSSCVKSRSGSRGAYLR